jgi:hypothetical protein
MSTRQTYAQPEPTAEQPATDATSIPLTRTPSERAPATFSRGNTERLRNLIDEWNTAFAVDSE